MKKYLTKRFEWGIMSKSAFCAPNGKIKQNVSVLTLPQSEAEVDMRILAVRLFEGTVCAVISYERSILFPLIFIAENRIRAGRAQADDPCRLLLISEL